MLIPNLIEIYLRDVLCYSPYGLKMGSGAKILADPACQVGYNYFAAQASSAFFGSGQFFPTLQNLSIFILLSQKKYHWVR